MVRGKFSGAVWRSSQNSSRSPGSRWSLIGVLRYVQSRPVWLAFISSAKSSL